MAESPVHLECRVRQIMSIGDGPIAANLVIGEVLLIHIDERVLDSAGQVDPRKLAHDRPARRQLLLPDHRPLRDGAALTSRGDRSRVPIAMTRCKSPDDLDRPKVSIRFTRQSNVDGSLVPPAQFSANFSARN